MIHKAGGAKDSLYVACTLRHAVGHWSVMPRTEPATQYSASDRPSTPGA